MSKTTTYKDNLDRLLQSDPLMGCYFKLLDSPPSGWKPPNNKPLLHRGGKSYFEVDEEVYRNQEMNARNEFTFAGIKMTKHVLHRSYFPSDRDIQLATTHDTVVSIIQKLDTENGVDGRMISKHLNMLRQRIELLDETQHPNKLQDMGIVTYCISLAHQRSQVFFPRNVIIPLKGLLEHHLLPPLNVDLQKQDLELQKASLFNSLIVSGIPTPKLKKLIDGLGVFSISPARGLRSLVLMGNKNEAEFWDHVKERTKQDTFPFGLFKEVIQYYGGLDTPALHYDSLMSGDRFPFDIIEPAILEQIPHRLVATQGTIGGFVKVRNVIYAVTAAHVVSSQLEILNHKFIFRGDWEEKTLDIAFLRIKDELQQTIFDPMTIEYEPDKFFFEENPDFFNFQDPKRMTTGIQVCKIGFATGLTTGHLIRADAVSTFKESERVFDKSDMVAVRWIPDQPFTLNGDSGSAYYAVEGCLRFPIAIHSFSGTHRSEMPHKTGGQSLVEVASFGTNLVSALNWWTRQNDIDMDDVTWVGK